MGLLPSWAPNVHPIIIHFPIALLFAAVLFDFIGLIKRDATWLSKAALLLFVLGAVAAIVAVITGHEAAGGLFHSGLLPKSAGADLHEHSELGEDTAWFFGIYALLRLILTWWGKMSQLSFAVIAFLIGFGGLFLVYETAEHGGKLVYDHNLGTQLMKEQMLKMKQSNNMPPPPSPSSVSDSSNGQNGGKTGGSTP